jgi:hypothetical protein
MAEKLTRPTHRIAIQLHAMAESCIIYSSRSGRPVWKLLDTPSCDCEIIIEFLVAFVRIRIFDVNKVKMRRMKTAEICIHRVVAGWVHVYRNTKTPYEYKSTVLGPTQFPVQCVPRALTPVAKRLGREADHSPPSSADVKNAWRYTSIPPYVSMEWCLIKDRIRLHGVELSEAQGQLYLDWSVSTFVDATFTLILFWFSLKAPPVGVSVNYMRLLVTQNSYGSHRQNVAESLSVLTRFDAVWVNKWRSGNASLLESCRGITFISSIAFSTTRTSIILSVKQVSAAVAL